MHDLSSIPADRWNAHDEAGASSRNIPVGVVARQPWTEHFAKIAAAQRLDTLFASPRWLAALADTYGFAVQASTLTVDGRVVAAIPYCDIDDIGGRRIVSLPFSDYVDPFVQSAAEWNALTAPLLADNLPIRFRCLRNQIPAADARFQRLTHAVWHCTDLARSEAEIATSIAASSRQNIRRAESAGVKVRTGATLDDLRIFYAMHCHVRKSKYGLFAQPFSFFENLHAQFAPGDLTVLLAELDGRAIAGILFLIHGDTLYYKFNASTDLAHRPNDLLVWHGIMLGQRRRLARLDFGISDLDQPGLVRFKRKFASKEMAVTELRWRPEGPIDVRGAQGQEILRRLTRILTAPHVPEDVSRAVGDEVYRYFG